MATAAERLQEAQDARHLLLIGESEVELQFNGRRVRMREADLGRLERYIAELKQEVAVENGARPAPRRRSVIFGGG